MLCLAAGTPVHATGSSLPACSSPAAHRTRHHRASAHSPARGLLSLPGSVPSCQPPALTASTAPAAIDPSRGPGGLPARPRAAETQGAEGPRGTQASRPAPPGRAGWPRRARSGEREAAPSRWLQPPRNQQPLNEGKAAAAPPCLPSSAAANEPGGDGVTPQGAHSSVCPTPAWPQPPGTEDHGTNFRGCGGILQ